MLLDQEQLPSFYNDIVSLSLKERTPVLILVARDVDSLCACHIFTVSGMKKDLLEILSYSRTHLPLVLAAKGWHLLQNQTNCWIY